jgi:alkylhydroperoxidase family enzyme
VARLPAVPDDQILLPINLFRAMGHAPEVARRYSGLGGAFLFNGTLDPRCRELVINAMAVKLDAPYEWSHHVGMGRAAGVTDDELRAVREGKLDALGDMERACVEYAYRVEDRAVTGADVDGLRGAGLSDEQIAELTLLAGFYGMTARFLTALDVSLDEGHQGFEAP